MTNIENCNCDIHSSMRKVNPKEAPPGHRAVRYWQAADCTEKCAFSNKDKKCKKANCGANFRTDRTEVYFEEGEK